MVVGRPDGQVLAFERGDVPGAWQLPQGGIDKGETPLDAAWRELGEETGLSRDDVELAGPPTEWIAYELPPEFRASIGRLGQVQRWFRFATRHDAVIPTVDNREFVAWKWVEIPWLVAQVPDFRRLAYQRGFEASWS